MWNRSCVVALINIIIIIIIIMNSIIVTSPLTASILMTVTVLNDGEIQSHVWMGIICQSQIFVQSVVLYIYKRNLNLRSLQHLSPCFLCMFCPFYYSRYQFNNTNTRYCFLFNSFRLLTPIALKRFFTILSCDCMS